MKLQLFLVVFEGRNCLEDAGFVKICGVRLFLEISQHAFNIPDENIGVSPQGDGVEVWIWVHHLAGRAG